MAGDEQDAAEAFDADKLDDDRDEPVGQLGYPPERPLGADDPTADDWVTDSVATRQDRMQPDPVEEVGETAVGAFDDGGAEGEAPFAGRLVEPGVDDTAAFPVDIEPDAIASDVVDGDDLTAEEAALHLE